MNKLLTASASAPAIEPKFATIPVWCALTGMSRTKTYEHIGSGDIVAIKLADRTLVDVDAGLAWLRSRPRAVIRMSTAQAAA